MLSDLFIPNPCEIDFSHVNFYDYDRKVVDSFFQYFEKNGSLPDFIDIDVILTNLHNERIGRLNLINDNILIVVNFQWAFSKKEYDINEMYSFYNNNIKGLKNRIKEINIPFSISESIKFYNHPKTIKLMSEKTRLCLLDSIFEELQEFERLALAYKLKTENDTDYYHFHYMDKSDQVGYHFKKESVQYQKDKTNKEYLTVLKKELNFYLIAWALFYENNEFFNNSKINRFCSKIVEQFID